MQCGPKSQLAYIYVPYRSGTCPVLEPDDRCQVNIGIPENGHPGCLFSRKYRHPDAYIYVNMGTGVPIFTVNMGIPL